MHMYPNPVCSNQMCFPKRHQHSHEVSRKVIPLFASYFPRNVQGFRRLLKDTRSIISASSALYILVGHSTWIPGDLDIIVPLQTLIQVIVFLCDQGFYQVSCCSHEDTYAQGLTVVNVRKFRHGSKKIDLIVTDACVHSPIEIALSHHSTPAMNYITSTHIHCPFPALTLHNQMAFNFKHSDVHQDGIKIAVKKYAVERAFKWIGFPPPAVVWEAMEDWALPY